VVLHFSGSGNHLQSVTYFVAAEPGTLALFGTGLALIGCLGNSHRIEPVADPSSQIGNLKSTI
jgi:hypothetical protein